MDGLYYADYFARPPKTEKMSKDELKVKKDQFDYYKIKKAYNWMTGSKI